MTPTLTNVDQSFTVAHFERFFEQSVSGFLITDPEGHILKSNAKLADWLGVSADELKGKRASDLLSIGSKIYFETHLWPLLRMQGFFDEVMLDLAGPKKQRMTFLVNAVECRDENNNPECIHYIVSKAADRIEYEKTLQQQKQMIESKLEDEKELVALREQLIAVLGHDLRNPLASTLLASEMLQESLTEEKYKDILGILRRSSLRMDELIGTIMDFAKSRMGGGFAINWQHAKLQPVLQQVVDELVLGSGGKEIKATFDIEEPVYCDPNRIAQLVSNLLANALTHGKSDTLVSIDVSHRNGILEFSVSNQGEKIADDLLPTLFEPFTREGKRKSQNGLGLGLYISSEIAQAHNGSLTCTSTDEETRFSFYMEVGDSNSSNN